MTTNFAITAFNAFQQLHVANVVWQTSIRRAREKARIFRPNWLIPAGEFLRRRPWRRRWRSVAGVRDVARTNYAYDLTK